MHKHKKWILYVVYRSSKTGKFVTAAYARRYPKTTEKQLIKYLRKTPVTGYPDSLPAKRKK